MRRRAILVALFTISVPAVSHAQAPAAPGAPGAPSTTAAPRQAQAPAAPPADDSSTNEPSGPSIPSGASGAVLTKPKDQGAPPTPAAPVVTPPILKKDDGALFPEQALTEGIADTVTVGVILDIGADGAVRGVKVEAPVGHGFDEAAIAAAKKLEYTPATRNGAPIP